MNLRLCTTGAATALVLSGLLATLTLGGKRPSLEADPSGYSIQLIRAEDAANTGSISRKPAADRLKGLLSGAFRWQRYWEMDRRHVPLHRGEVTKVRLSADCEVEIEMLSPRVRETRIYINGTLASRSRRAVHQSGPEISGGDRADGTAWFVIIEDLEGNADHTAQVTETEP